MTRLRDDLPDRPRVIYGKNPLAEVICAVKFPPILLLSRDVPADFQGLIQKDYPMAEVLERVSIRVGTDDSRSKESPRRSYKFSSENSDWSVSVEPEILALTTTNYERWEEFLPRFQTVLSAFSKVYTPPFFSRIGLRFQSVLVREELNLAGSGWGELLHKEVLATFAHFCEFNSELPPMELAMVLDIDSGKVRIKLNSVKTDKGEHGFLVDTDCFVDSENFRSVDDVFSRLEQLHKYSGRVFRACITDHVHEALRPNPGGT